MVSDVAGSRQSGAIPVDAQYQKQPIVDGCVGWTIGNRFEHDAHRQLDGGHVSFGLFGTRSTWVGLVVMALAGTYLLAYGMMMGQMHIFTVMYFLALLMGPRHPPSRDDNRSLGWPRQIIGVLSLGIPILCIPANPIVLV